MYEKNIIADSGSHGNGCGISSSGKREHRNRFADSRAAAAHHQSARAGVCAGSAGSL
jgi:hypothetical protein